MWKRIVLKVIVFLAVCLGTAWVVNYIYYRGYQDVSVEMQDSALPVVYLKYEDQIVDRMLGYTQTMDTRLDRETIIPVGDDKKVTVVVQNDSNYFQNVSYELRTLDGETLIETDVLSNSDRSDGFLQFSVNLRMDMTLNQEYVFVVRLNKSEEESIRYYSRIVRLSRNHTTDFINYAKDFNKASFLEKTMENASSQDAFEEGYTTENVSPILAENINIDKTSQNENFGYVNLESSIEEVTWGEMYPKVMSEVVPTLREIDADNAVIQMQYVIQSSCQGEARDYIVNEYYKIKYDNSVAKIYLEQFDRYMNAIYRYDDINTTNNSINIGISSNEEVEYSTSENLKKAAFVVNGQLWYYDYLNTTMTNVYGLWSDKFVKISEIQNKGDIKVVDVSDDGNIIFAIYGRIDKGEHEGKNGIVLYYYDAEKSEIREMAFIGCKVPFDVLKKQVEKFTYYDKEEEIFYAYIGESLVEYHVKNGDFKTIFEKIPEQYFAVSSDMKIIAYPNTSDLDKVSSIIIRNFETRTENEKTASSSSVISIVGFVDHDLVYGEAKEENIYQGADGCTEYLFSQIFIVDDQGNNVKNYSREGILISDVEIQTEMVYLKRCSVSEGVRTECSDDYISYKVAEQENEITFGHFYDDKGYNNLQMVFPVKVYIQSIPSEGFTKYRKNENIIEAYVDWSVNEKGCYLFSNRGYVDMYFSVGDAVVRACKENGMVFDASGNAIYKPKEVASYYTIAGNFDYQSCDTIDQSLWACCYMSMLSAGIQAEYNDVLLNKNWEASFDEENRVRGVNISGVDLPTALGYLSDGVPFAVKINDGRFVLVVSYNSTHIRYYDPLVGSEVKVERKKFEKTMKDNENTVYSYIRY